MDASPLLSLLTVLVGLLSGGSDLLDAIPSQSYWSRQGVTLSTDAMVDLLSAPPMKVEPLILQLKDENPTVRRAAAERLADAGLPAIAKLTAFASAPDTPAESAELTRQVVAVITRRPHASEIRRLMAIRTLGELGEARGLAVLETLSKSRDPFVADYTGRAMARIMKKPLPARLAEVPQDVWLLPAQCRAVAQCRPVAGQRVGLADAIAAAWPDAKRRSAFLDEYAADVESFAEGVGNIQFYSITIGLAGEPAAAKPTASAVVMIRAKYDQNALRDWLRANRLAVRMNDDCPVLDLGPEVTLALPADDCVLLVAATAGRPALQAEAVAAVRAGKGGMAAAEGPLADWLRKADLKQFLWGVGFFTATDAAAGLPRGLQWMAFYGVPAGKPGEPTGIDLHLLLSGQHEGDVHQAADALKGMLRPMPLKEGDSASALQKLIRRAGPGVQVRKTPGGAELTVPMTTADVVSSLPHQTNDEDAKPR